MAPKIGLNPLCFKVKLNPRWFVSTFNNISLKVTKKTRRKKVHVVLAASIKAELIFLSPKIYLLPTQKIMLTIRYQTRFDLRQGLISIVEVGIGIGAMVRGIVILFSFKKNKNLTFFILIYLFNFFGSMVDIKI